MPLNPNEAFGLPKGTVRAILAIILVTAFVCVGIASHAITDLKEVAMVVAVAYFVGKSAAPK